MTGSVFGVTALEVDTGSFLAIVAAAAVAGTLVAVAGGRGLFLPVVVVELTLGVLIGPQLLDLAHVNAFTEFFADLGLGMLFFFAGYEIDLARIRGTPLRLGLSAGRCRSRSPTPSAASSPRPAWSCRSSTSGPHSRPRRSGPCCRSSPTPASCAPLRHLPARRGRRGRVRPDPAAHARPLDAERGAQRPDPRRVRPARRRRRGPGGPLVRAHPPAFERTLESSSQLAVRWFVVLVFALALLAYKLGLDLLLGGFAAGLITGRSPEVGGRGVRLEAQRGRVRVLVPFFFVVSGLRLDVDALFSSVVQRCEARALLRAVPRRPRNAGAAALPRRPAAPGRPFALALFSATQLPLVVAITTLAVDEGHMRSSTAAALVGAGALSTLAGPLHGLRMRRIAAEKRAGGGVSQPRHAHHEVRPAGRVLRLRIWLSSAMWLPVLATNLVVIVARARPAGHRRARRRARSLPIAALGGAGDLRRARRRHDHVHRHRVLGGLRRRADPDVVLLPAAGRAAAARPGRSSPASRCRPRRRPTRSFALATIGHETDRRRAATSCPPPPSCSGSLLALVTLGAFVALVQRAFESTQIGGILRTLMRRGYAVIEEVHPRDIAG